MTGFKRLVVSRRYLYFMEIGCSDGAFLKGELLLLPYRRMADGFVLGPFSIVSIFLFLVVDGGFG